MKYYQIIDTFVQSISHSSLFSMCEQTDMSSYQELTDFFNKEYISQETILEVKDKLFTANEGYLVADEIVISKSKTGKSKFVKRRYKSAGGYVTSAISIVLLVWTDGVVRIPLRLKLQINGEKVSESLLELLGWYRNKISRKVACVLFDSGFACATVFKRIDDYGWCFITRIPKSRSFNGKAIYKTHKGGFWNKVGYIKGHFKVKAVRDKAKFYITNRLSLNRHQIIDIYSKRAVIEEVFRILKQECHWSRCQLRDHQAYERYYTVGILSFMYLEHLRIKGYGTTIYRIRRNILFHQLFKSIPHYQDIAA